MVAKLTEIYEHGRMSLNLAKIHMAAKLVTRMSGNLPCLNLAKIHMVAKPK